MRWLDLVRLRLRTVFRRTAVDRDLDDELQAYVDERIEQGLAGGLTRGDATRAAHASLGSPIRVREQCRDVRRLTLLDDLIQDLRHGVRLLRRNPLFAISASLVLAIGIGATTAIFTVANGLLLRGPVGVTEPDRLVDIYGIEEGNSLTSPMVAYAEYEVVRERATTLDGVYGFEMGLSPMSLRSGAGSGPEGGQAGGTAERVFAGLVTSNYFSVLGVPAAAGRLFGPQDGDQAGAVSLVVLSHAFWSRRFHADPSIVGRTLTLNGHAFTVTGVAREGFTGTSVMAPEIWVPAAMTAIVKPGTDPRTPWRGLQLLAGARLKPGVLQSQAAAEVETIGRGLPTRRMALMGGPDGATKVRQPGQRGLRLIGTSPIPGRIRTLVAGFLALLVAMVSVVLVITCTNIAGILLARATARRRELAVRLAMGAGRRRLIRQLLAETLLLFVLGGAAGLLLARAMIALLLSALPAFEQPVAVAMPLDGRVIAFTCGLSLLAALLSGLAPSLQASKADVVSALKDDAPGLVDRSRLRGAFVVAQVAFSLLLVVVAGLHVRALERVALRDPGYDPRHVEVASLDLSLAGHTDATGPALLRTLRERVSRLPGVQSATVTEGLPSANLFNMADEGVTVPGVPPPPGRPFFGVSWTVTEPGLFATLRLPLIAGRDFDDGDRAGTQPVVILPESTARRLWPGQDAVGRYLQYQSGGLADVSFPKPVRVTPLLVIGVVRDIRGSRDGNVPALAMYRPLAQRYAPRVMLLARTTQGQRITGEIRAALAAIDPNLPIVTTRMLEDELLGPVETQLRVAASVAGSVGLIGVLVAAVGIYGVTAYAVVRRTREIGIRIAMGAQRNDVVRLVLRQGMTLVVSGAAIGLALAALASRLMTRLLFGVSPLDPIAFGGAALLFAAIGLVACYLPARRATQIDAMEALRYE